MTLREVLQNLCSKGTSLDDEVVVRVLMTDPETLVVTRKQIPINHLRRSEDGKLAISVYGGAATQPAPVAAEDDGRGYLFVGGPFDGGRLLRENTLDDAGRPIEAGGVMPIYVADGQYAIYRLRGNLLVFVRISDGKIADV